MTLKHLTDQAHGPHGDDTAMNFATHPHTAQEAGKEAKSLTRPTNSLFPNCNPEQARFTEPPPCNPQNSTDQLVTAESQTTEHSFVDAMKGHSFSCLCKGEHDVMRAVLMFQSTIAHIL